MRKKHSSSQRSVRLSQFPPPGPLQQCAQQRGTKWEVGNVHLRQANTTTKGSKQTPTVLTCMLLSVVQHDRCGEHLLHFSISGFASTPTAATAMITIAFPKS
eukprot:3917711-Amphidinium_carterae.1